MPSAVFLSAMEAHKVQFVWVLGRCTKSYNVSQLRTWNPLNPSEVQESGGEGKARSYDAGPRQPHQMVGPGCRSAHGRSRDDGSGCAPPYAHDCGRVRALGPSRRSSRKFLKLSCSPHDIRAGTWLVLVR